MGVRPYRLEDLGKVQEKYADADAVPYVARIQTRIHHSLLTNI